MQYRNRFQTGFALALAGLALPVSQAGSAAPADPFDGSWHYSVTPYLWLPNINANLNYNLPARAANQFSTRIGPNDYLSHLNFAVMLTGEARKGNWSALTDIIYMDLGGESTHVRNVKGPQGRVLATAEVRGQTGLSSTVWTLAGAYTLAHRPPADVDLLVGVRYLGLSTDLKWQFAANTVLPVPVPSRAGRVSNNRQQWDGIIGAKGQVRFGSGQWFMPYYVDVGTGDSNLTWQALLGVGYHFGWGDVTLAVRSLSYAFKERDMDLRLTGPALGFTARW